jgi:hypothetical protein
VIDPGDVGADVEGVDQTIFTGFPTGG